MKIACAIDEIKALKPEELKDTLDNDKAGKYLLVDVRQPEEYEEEHIPGAIFIPLGELEHRQSELSREKKIITYCRSGRRSLAAAIVLCENGFTKLHHLDGGMMNWHYDKISGIPEPTKKFIPEAVSTRDILILAIQMEKASMDFYRAVQQETKLAKEKETLEMLENSERKHMEQLYDRLSNLVGRDNLPPLDKLIQDEASYMEGGLEINKALTELESKISGELEFLEIGIEKEYMAYDFYKRAAAMVTDTNSRSLLHELAKQERGHSSILLDRLAQVVRQK